MGEGEEVGVGMDRRGWVWWKDVYDSFEREVGGDGGSSAHVGHMYLNML